MTLPLRCVFHCLSFFAKDSAFPVCCHCLSSSLRTVPFPRVCTGGGGNLCGHLLRRAQPNLLSKHCCTQSICIPLLKSRGGKVDYEFFCHTHTHTHTNTPTRTRTHTHAHTPALISTARGQAATCLTEPSLPSAGWPLALSSGQPGTPGRPERHDNPVLSFCTSAAPPDTLAGVSVGAQRECRREI